MSNRARVVGVRPVADGVLEYRLQLVAPPRVSFSAGQYLSLDCGLDEQGLPQRRAYSIASPPGDDGHLVICAKLIAGGLGSRLLQRLGIGDEVDFTGPLGFFVLDQGHAGDVVFCATGTGIVPVVPMLQELLARDETGRVLLFWGMRAPADVFYREVIDALAERHPRLEVHLSLTRPGPEWRGEQGRIGAKVLGALPALSEPVFYLVGNGAMIDEVRAALKARGVDRRRFRTEAFFTPGAEPA
ncbi:MAG: FAD-dependent oxidoreductase [Deltaproteobacteria bacterium]|nr:FAD-dependent oxidoreductase [Deltaproteobacteria bacterium]